MGSEKGRSLLLQGGIPLLQEGVPPSTKGCSPLLQGGVPPSTWAWEAEVSS